MTFDWWKVKILGGILLWQIIVQVQADQTKFKYEVANEIGVPLKQGYNGDLTSAQNGYVGGYMVKKMIEAQERKMAGGQQ